MLVLNSHSCTIVSLLYWSLQLKFLCHLPIKILCKFLYVLHRSEYFFMVSQPDFYTAFICWSCTPWLLSTEQNDGGRVGCVEKLNVAHPTDLGPEEPVLSKGTNSPQWSSPGPSTGAGGAHGLPVGCVRRRVAPTSRLAFGPHFQYGSSSLLTGNHHIISIW
jgi:hypothetical protein